jgi:voltage-gated potassium channel
MTEVPSRKQNFADIVNRVDGLWVGELDPMHIQMMEDDVSNRQENLRLRAGELELKLRSDLERKHVEDLERDHDEFRHTQYEYERLEHIKTRLYNKKQRRIVWHGLRSKLGPERAVRLEKIVLVLIVVVLAILFAEMIFGRRLSTTIIWSLYAVDFSACMVFLYEFRLRYREAQDKAWFWKHNWIDLVSSLPIPPFMPTADLTTIARTARFFRILRLLRAVRIVALLWSGMEKLDRVADVRLLKRSLASVGALLLLGAILVHMTEVGGAQNTADSSLTGAEILDTEGFDMGDVGEFHETIWWTFNTIATGGFADLYKPQRAFTRLVTALLILAGFVVLGVFIATLSAAYKGEDAQELQRNQRYFQESLEKLLVNQQAINQRLSKLHETLPPR